MVFLDPAVTLRRYQDWLDPGSVSFGAAGRVGRKKPKSDLDPSVVEKEKPEGTGIDDKKGWFVENQDIFYPPNLSKNKGHPWKHSSIDKNVN